MNVAKPHNPRPSIDLSSEESAPSARSARAPAAQWQVGGRHVPEAACRGLISPRRHARCLFAGFTVR